MSIKFHSISITPNPATANQPFLIAVDVEHVILAYTWNDLKVLTWAQAKQKTWDELSIYSNMPQPVYSGEIASGQISRL